MDEQLFHVDKYSFKDSFEALLELDFSSHLKILDFISSLTLLGKYYFLKDFLSLMICFCYYLLTSDRDKIISVSKLLEWLLWKSVFT